MSAIARRVAGSRCKKVRDAPLIRTPAKRWRLPICNPIDIEDVKLLIFDEEGKAVARANASEWERQRVEETVKRLKLNEHVALAEERRKVWGKVSDLIVEYQRASERARSGDNGIAREKAKTAAKEIRGMTQGTAELSAVAQWCILFRNDPQLLTFSKVMSCCCILTLGLTKKGFHQLG